MKVLERATTPDGTKIQIEDWTESHDCFKTLSIGAYPTIIRNPTSTDSFMIKIGEPLRVSIHRDWKDNEEVRKAFEDLKYGTKNIKDFSKQFWNLWAVECL